jgi:membrane protein DedA with SNARE-associated domain
MWPESAQAAAIFFGTFVLEDVAAVGAGLLLAAGTMSWPTALLACFLGIWAGDAGLYALARVAGRNWFERASKQRYSGRVARSEKWFAQKGDSILIFSRLIPGARLPTYLAAGFLRVPLGRFLTVTGAASLVWTVVILSVSQVAGVKALPLIGTVRHGGVALILIGASVFGVVTAARKIANPKNARRIQSFFGRMRRWEFWPAWMFYPPVALYAAWLAVKYRGLTLPTAANPGIFSGGMVGESKIATLNALTEGAPEFTAEAQLLERGPVEDRIRRLDELCERRGIVYPFILKPDIGHRGAGVKLIHSHEQAEAYLSVTTAPLVVQRYAEGPSEAGIFYYRFPHEERGRIFAITKKIFPRITGDGRSTVEELIWNDPRARFVAAKYLKRLAGREDEVLGAGVTLRLVEAGNHAQGCIFRDGMRLLTPQLEERFDAISKTVPGFYVGRYDIRYASEEELRAGRSFKIVELNGAASEATSIYDEKNSLWSAYRTLFRQWDLVFAIGAANRARGCETTKVAEVWKSWRQYSRDCASYPAAD